jgi:dTDP-glucose pyrophosphorylase
MSDCAQHSGANLLVPNLSLVVLAGGMGSRFGGNKQLALVGNTGRTLLHFSVMDAYSVGIRHLVLVVRESLRELFAAQVLPHFPSDLQVNLICQQISDLPETNLSESQLSELIRNRQKPWGTAHALWSARKVLVGRSVIVLNADDYYGDEAMQLLARHFQTSSDWAMVAFPVIATLSEFGGVNRGVCLVEQSMLRQVTEWTEIASDVTGQVNGVDGQGVTRQLDIETPVSMNIWGFSAPMMSHLQTALFEFLQRNPSVKAECYLPAVVDNALLNGQRLKVYLSSQLWHGITYPDDLPKLAVYFQQKIDTCE